MEQPASADSAAPQVRRVRVCFLGKDSFQHFVARTDVAAALLRGLTADEPEAMDPVLDCVFHAGVFEQIWWGLQEEPPHEGVMRCDRWGVGPLKAWEGRMRFEAEGFDETIPHESAEGTAE